MSNGAPQKVYPTVWQDGPSNAPQPIVDTQSDALKVEVQQKNPGSLPDETTPEKVQAHNEVAKNLLAQKNRKRKGTHGPRMELPFDPTMEEGSIWTLVGFAPNFDGPWLVHEVVFTFTGKGGSRLEIDLMQPPDVTASTSAVPPDTAKKTELLTNSNVGEEPNPEPSNLGFGGKDASWLEQQEESAAAGD
jgi:hypothetical protein